MDRRASSQALWRAALDLNRAAALVDPRAADLPPLIFMTDPDRTLQPWRVAARLPAGAAVIHRGFGRAEAADEAARLREATQAQGVRLLIAADLDLALRVGADGLHLPQRDLVRASEARTARHDWLITGAAHAPLPDLSPALDAVLVSPVFAPGGTSAPRPALGPQGLRRLIDALPLPAYALGGVDAATVERLMGTGACGIAAVDAVTLAWGD